MGDNRVHTERDTNENAHTHNQVLLIVYAVPFQRGLW